MSRLTLTDADKQARNWFQETCESLGCTVKADTMGNQFATRPGRSSGAPTAAGSHLDTQPMGGRYDGIFGVTAGIALLRALHTSNRKTNYPVAVVNWTNEEGARFPISMVSSGVWAGAIPLEKAFNLRSVVPGEENVTMGSELQRLGYDEGEPDITGVGHQQSPLAAHFELHIEQGPLLERGSKQIGIVKGVQSYSWNTLNITGRSSHTGTTDFDSRADALLAASKMVVAARQIAHEQGALATVGILEARPGAVNTVPGSVRMSLDVRGRSNEIRDRTLKNLRETFNAIARGQALPGANTNEPRDKVELDWRVDSVSDAVNFHDDCVSCVEAAADAADGVGSNGRMDMVSGAGHDSVYTSRVCPTSMVFVPCKDGVSHNPREYSSPDDCARGAQVLGDAVLRYDELRGR